MVDFYRLPIGAKAPDVVHVVVEIPKGSRNKIEFDAKLGVFKMDRVLYSSTHYPGDYGFIPRTYAPDGDPLDILVLVTEPTFTGCILSARPIAVLEMNDEKGVDEKILAVPDGDPRFAEMYDKSNLPGHLIREIEHFFEVYKELEGGKQTTLFGWYDAIRAREVIQRSRQSFGETEEARHYGHSAGNV